MGDLDGKSILVTGGTGSFGYAFVKNVLASQALKRLVVFSRDELKQFEMANQISAPNLRYFLGDIRDQSRLERALDGIDIVIHAAAMKHVVASEYNPMECVKTNVIGAENLINAAINMEVDQVLALSTDKAVNPLNLYGATKLCSDKLFIAANHLSKTNGTKFSVVRYGNVIGSRGSVIPLFKEQKKIGELTITDPRMTRFWLTVNNGVEFVIKNITRMLGGEIFIPKIPSMSISDVATAIAPECKQKFVGIRSGEKLHEIMIPQDEANQTLEFDDFYIILPKNPLWGKLENALYDGSPGKPVASGFSYASDNNSQWITTAELAEIISA